MEGGTRFADRFEIERKAGSGGMGVVYRARDLVTGELVALKVVPSGGNAARFLREASILARLHHPGIVRHVASGESSDGRLWLAMEWLEGEDLAVRLQRKSLHVGESLSLARHAAEALRAAHAKGVIHRDVKPSNLFLAGRDIDRVTLLDFGIARADRQAEALTASGTFVGTLGYASPEHAEGSRDVDARADIYSLGCVLFECLTGRRAFPGSTPLEVLAKAMLETVPDVRDVRPDLPACVAALVARMTEKARAKRFDDATSLLAAIVETEQLARGATSALGPPAARTRLAGEQRLVSLVVLVAPDAALGTSTTMTPPTMADQEKRARVLVERAGAALARGDDVQPSEVRVLSNGLIAALRGGESATDLAVAATRCALGLRTIHPEMEAALATGRVDADVAAGALLTTALGLVETGHGSGFLRIDETTARLVETRFTVRRAADVDVVIGPLRAGEPARTLLGKPTPCIGRDKEIRLLEATFDECEAESVARAVLVSAPPGTGKSRLLREMADRFASAGERATVLGAAADQGASRAALSLVALLVMSATDLPPGTPAAEVAESVRARVRNVLAGDAHASAYADFLAELFGAAGHRPPTPLLAAARNEPRIMHEWLVRSFEEWLGAETRRRPVAVLLEDLHWADTASLEFLGAAMRRCADLPLFVLAVARPEVVDRLPEALARGPLQEIRLGGLTRKSAEKLVHLAAPGLSADETARIVERASGNAFYLEELVRWVSARPEAGSAAPTTGAMRLPETVLLMAQSRLEKLPAAARRMLRAASVFGGTAWVTGIDALLGGDVDTAKWVDALVLEEVLEARTTSRFAGQREVAFRHALVREASYATLPDHDRREGHALAAKWLAEAGERDPLVLAEHLAFAGEGERAAPHFLAAAELAASAGNLQGVIDLAERGLAGGASGLVKGNLLATSAHAHGWRTEWKEVLELAPLALDLLEPGTVPWWLVAGGTVFAGASVGDSSRTPAIVRHVMALPGHPDPTGPCGFAMALLALGSLNAGRGDLASMFLARYERIAAEGGEPDPVFLGWLHLTRDAMALYTEDDPAEGIREAREGTRQLDLAGDPVGRTITRVYEGVALFEAGDARAAVARHDEAIALAEATGVHYSIVYGRAQRARALVALGEAESAIASASTSRDEADMLISSIAGLALAEAYFAVHETSGAAGALERARAEATAIANGPLVLPRAGAHLVLARAALAEGDRAFARASLARAEENAVVGYPRARSEIALLQLQLLLAEGDLAAVETTRARAAQRIERVASQLDVLGFARAWRALPVHRALLGG